jgi:hypothetical protein
MKTMTAVEWLIDELNKSIGLTKFVEECDEEYKNEILTIIQQANAMFEEQMAMADKNGQDRNQYNRDLEYGGAEYWDNEPLEFEQWYNETFNS